MAVRIVTDSISDLPADTASSLGITVVPLRIRFGTEEFRDGVDLSADQFYEKLRQSPFFPATSAPSPAEFGGIFDSLAVEADGILVITLSSKLSATFDCARQGIPLMKRKCRVEVFDSLTATMAEGFIVMKAAEAAVNGAGFEEVAAVSRREASRAHLLAFFDTLEYLRKGGRIGAARQLLGSLLKIHPLITVEDGVVKPAGRTRSKAAAIECLRDYVAGFQAIDALAVGNTACPADADSLIEALGPIYPKERMHRTRLTPAIGSHTGPGLVVVSLLGNKA
jgi:DegV family protein with EDD domain